MVVDGSGVNFFPSHASFLDAPLSVVLYHRLWPRIARTFFFRYHYCGVPKHMAYQEEVQSGDGRMEMGVNCRHAYH